MGTAHFTKFWSSIINDSGMQDQLKSVMSIVDEEERALQLLTRTLFILVMEIKHERDEANKNLNQLMENIRTCKSCGMMTKFDAHCETRKNADMNCNGLKHQKEVPNLSFPENCMEMETSKKLILVEGDDIASEEGHIAPQLKDPMGLNYSKIKNIKYRCLSRYPKGNSPNIGQEDEENEESIIKSETEEQNIPKILAPETLSLDENEFHVSSSQKRTFETNIVSVPETLAIENTRSIDNECEVVSNEKSNPVLDSRVGIEGELRSPSRNHTGMADSLNQRSPVLGKKTRQATSKSLKQSIRMDFPKALDFEEFNKESHKPVEINTPESKVTKVTSTPKFSPRVFTHSLSTSFNDSDNTSPSLLPPVKTKAIRCNTKENYFPSLPAALNKIENQGQSTSKGRKEFQKSISSYNMPLPSIKPFSLRRHQSVDKQSKRSSYKMSIDPPEVQKNYKQTKISESIFQKKTDVALFTGGVARKGLTFLDDEKAAVSAALEESLKTKAIYDMMRKKQKGLLNAESTCDIKKMKGAHTLIDGVDGQNLDPTSSPVSRGEINTSNPRKEKSKVCSPIKSPLLTPRKHKSGPGKRQQESPCKERGNPRKRKKIEEKPKKGKEEEILEIDQLLDQVNCSPPQKSTVENKPNKLKSPEKKSLSRKQRNKLFDNSFDIIPVKNAEPEFAHQGEVVRKKADRKQLEGWQCHECEQWYEAEDLNPEEKKMMMNKCSRHRSKYNPLRNTPKNFWNPDWIDEG